MCQNMCQIEYQLVGITRRKKKITAASHLAAAQPQSIIFASAVGRPERVPWESRAFTTWSPAHRPIAQAQDLSVKRQDNTCFFLWFWMVFLYGFMMFTLMFTHPISRCVSNVINFSGLNNHHWPLKWNYRDDLSTVSSAWLFCIRFDPCSLPISAPFPTAPGRMSVLPSLPELLQRQRACLELAHRVSLASTHPQKIWVRLNHPKYRWKVSMSGKFDKNFI